MVLSLVYLVTGQILPSPSRHPGEKAPIAVGVIKPSGNSPGIFDKRRRVIVQPLCITHESPNHFQAADLIFNGEAKTTKDDKVGSLRQGHTIQGLAVYLVVSLMSHKHVGQKFLPNTGRSLKHPLWNISADVFD